MIGADPDAWYGAGPEQAGRRPSRLPAGHPRPRDRPGRDLPTATTTTPTGALAAGSPAPPWSCGPPATTWATCTATSSPSGTPGRPTCAATFPSGHHMAEEAPDALAAELLAFLAAA